LREKEAGFNRIREKWQRDSSSCCEKTSHELEERLGEEKKQEKETWTKKKNRIEELK